MMMKWPTKKYSVILADPPWKYTNWKGKDSGAAKAHYSCMTVKDIAAMPVKNITADDCALFMWSTGPKIAEGAHLPIFESWGFRPVTTAFVWNKTTSKGAPYVGLGFYTRSGAEFCLLGIKGRMPRKKEATSVLQVLTAPRIYRHSAKPAEQYERIEALYDGPYFELFARERRPGWNGFGNDYPEE